MIPRKRCRDQMTTNKAGSTYDQNLHIGPVKGLELPVQNLANRVFVPGFPGRSPSPHKQNENRVRQHNRFPEAHFVKSSRRGRHFKIFDEMHVTRILLREFRKAPMEFDVFTHVNILVVSMNLLES
jgi:hypothetical protein